MRASRAFAGPHSTEVLVSALGPGYLGGDTTTVEGRVGHDAHLVVQAQSATKAYGPGASIARARWSVAPGGTLEIRGLPLLLFGGAAHDSQVEIDLIGDARFILTDYVAFVEERHATARLSMTVRRDGELVLRDSLALDRIVTDGAALGTFFSTDAPSHDGSVERALLRSAIESDARFGIGSSLGGGLFVRTTGPRVWHLQTLLSRLLPQAVGSLTYL